jgi:hypothetical protein
MSIVKLGTEIDRTHSYMFCVSSEVFCASVIVKYFVRVF